MASSVASPSRPPGKNEKVDKWLSKSGLSELTMDPASYEALRNILPDETPRSGLEPLSSTTLSSSSSSSRSAALSPPNDLSKENDEDLGAESMTPVERRILETLAHQTRMLASLEQRVQELTQALHDESTTPRDSLYRPREASSNFTGNHPTLATPVLRRRRRSRDQEIHPQDHEQAVDDGNRGVGHGHDAVPQQQPVSFMLTLYRLLKLFVQLIPHKVQLDMGILIKFVVLCIVFSSRLQRRSRRSSKGMLAQYRRGITVTFLLMALGYQTGYFGYVLWFSRQNFVERIRNGEIIDVNTALHGRPAAPPQAVARGELDGAEVAGERPPPAFNWRETILGGRINRDGRLPGVMQPLVDIGLVLLSFILSIFPMWHPEGPPPLPNEPQEEEELEDDEEDDAEETLDDPPPLVEDFPDLPRVNPPVDPLEAAEDDDDDEEDEHRE